MVRDYNVPSGPRTPWTRQGPHTSCPVFVFDLLDLTQGPTEFYSS